MKKIKHIFIFCSLLFSTLSFSYYTHEEIIEEFSGPKERPIPEFMNQFIIPKLNNVIPKYLQIQLRTGPAQGELTFENLEGKDLRYRDTPIVSQIGGRCSTYGLVASIENLLGAPRLAKISESHLWFNYRLYSSVAAVEAAKRMSITEYKMWPRERLIPLPGWEAKAHTSLQYITYIGTDIKRAVKTLSQGRPVYLGVSVTESMMQCRPVLDANSPDTGGGHAASISGYKIDKRVEGGGYFIIKNSWGVDCGDKGYFYMPFNYCTRRGTSYCIMWDVQGVNTTFPGVPSIEPVLPHFNMKKMQVDFTSHKRWYNWRRKVKIRIWGESLHARQIASVTFAVDDGAFTNPINIDIDSINLEFKTLAVTHDITLRIKLNDGKVVQNKYQWRLQ